MVHELIKAAGYIVLYGGGSFLATVFFAQLFKYLKGEDDEKD